MIRKFSLVLLVIIAISGIFISKNDSSVTVAIRTYVIDFTYPVITFLSKPFEMVEDLNKSIKSYFFVHKKNKELLAENKELKKKLIDLLGAAYENDRLRGLLSYTQNLDYKYISTVVVGSTGGTFFRSILVNSGAKDNVKKGQAVVSEDGLVGRVIEVGRYTSRILLLTDLNSNIPIITNKSREHGIMSGDNEEMPKLLYLPKDSSTTDGEIILTSGEEEVYPPGLHVGIIKIGSDGIRRVIPFAKLHNLDQLSIIDYLE
jgi:rod shape-determining protein MreC